MGPYAQGLVRALRGQPQHEGTGPLFDVRLEVTKPANPTRWIASMARLARRYDLLNVHYPCEGWGQSPSPGVFPALIPVMRRGASLIVTMHEWTSMHPLRKMSVLPLAAACRAAVFASREEEKAFRRHLITRRRGYPPVTATIPATANLPIQVDRAAARRHRAVYLGQDAPSERLLGFFGFLYGTKQPSMILHTLRELRSRGERVRLVIVGDFPADHIRERAEFLALQDRLGIRSDISWLGYVEDPGKVAAVLAACDGLLLPFDEGVTTRRGTFWYAVALGIPIITTAPRGRDEFEGELDLEKLASRRSLFLVPPPGSPREFADATSLLPAWREDAAPAPTVPTFEAIAARYLTVFRDAIRPRSSRIE